LVLFCRRVGILSLVLVASHLEIGEEVIQLLLSWLWIWWLQNWFGSGSLRAAYAVPESCLKLKIRMSFISPYSLLFLGHSLILDWIFSFFTWCHNWGLLVRVSAFTSNQ
jgi:hypothetical protein